MAHPFMNIDPKILSTAKKAEASLMEVYMNIDETAEHNTAKILAAFAKHGLSETHFAASTGYGYGDRGREVMEEIFADITQSEAALLRHNFVSGTHALTVALFGILRPGDRMVCLTGTPYDTLHSVIGLGNSAENQGSLKDFGIIYDQLELDENGFVQLNKIPEMVKGAKVAYIQRSRGYSLRKSLTIADIEAIVAKIKEGNPGAIVVVDNCYGEFVEEKEPTQVGADLIIGSLIKNPGAGIARTGGYIAGRKNFVELCAYRLTAPGVGAEVGCTLGFTREIALGLFFAPTVVASAVKTAAFAAALFEEFGYAVAPKPKEKRTDLIQTVLLKNSERLVAFCQGVQKGAPVDSFVTPVPWDMPGYDSKVIMAAGAFTLGSSIELSADAPLREPFAVYLQGGLTYPSGKLGVMLAANSMLEQNLL